MHLNKEYILRTQHITLYITSWPILISITCLTLQLYMKVCTNTFNKYFYFSVNNVWINKNGTVPNDFFFGVVLDIVIQSNRQHTISHDPNSFKSSITKTDWSKGLTKSCWHCERYNMLRTTRKRKKIKKNCSNIWILVYNSHG